MARRLGRAFVDKVKVALMAGKGGDGHISFRREAHVPFGGPDGGNGGAGGNISIISNHHLKDLKHIKHTVRAESGGGGRRSQREGRRGQDTVLRVPMGTTLTVEGTGEVVYDIDTPMSEPVVILEGGAGGKGNRHFRSALLQAPRLRTHGEPGATKIMWLELKSIADFGLVGYPNAGKSTLLRAISNSKTEVGNYPFTTLQPEIGRVSIGEHRNAFSVADLPGLIEEAHLNKGLGFEFLRHTERTKGLVYVIDINPGYKKFSAPTQGVLAPQVLQILKRELELYQPGLSERALMVLLNKIDTEDEDLVQLVKEEVEAVIDLPVYLISAQHKIGLEEPLRIMYEHVRRSQAAAAATHLGEATEGESEIGECRGSPPGLYP